MQKDLVSGMERFKLQTMEKQYDYIIGIDPDSKRSGVSFLSVKTRELEIGTKSFPELFDWLRQKNLWVTSWPSDFCIVVEGGWLNRSNWHYKSYGNESRGSVFRKAAEMGRNVGMNHQTGMLIVEMCEHNGYDVEVIPPLQKIWSGPDRKITAEELAIITGYHARTNQDARDAALLAWHYAGLPIRIPAKAAREIPDFRKEWRLP